MTGKNKRIKILSNTELNDLYSLPKFTLVEREIFFSLNKKEQNLIETIPDIPSKIYVILQLGYCKAKGRIFSFNYKQVAEDVHYVTNKFFDNITKYDTILLKARKAKYIGAVLSVLNFREFNTKIRKQLVQHSLFLAKIHSNHLDIFRELLAYIHVERIILPNYTVLQDIISLSINIEARRISNIFREYLPDKLLTFLSDMVNFNNPKNQNFVELKLDQKNFKLSSIKLEVKKSSFLTEFYLLSKQLIARLQISPKSVKYYANIVIESSLYRLQQLKPDSQKLYLVCFINHCYQQIEDSLITSFIYHINNFEKESKDYAYRKEVEYVMCYSSNLPKVSKLLRYMGTEGKNVDSTIFWNTANIILPQSQYIPTADYIDGTVFDPEEARWKFYSNNSRRIKGYLRTLFVSIEFKSGNPYLLDAINFLKSSLRSKISLNSLKMKDFPDKFIPASKKKYLQTTKKIAIKTEKSKSYKTVRTYEADKYEFFLYQTIAKAIERGSVFCEDSHKYKSLASDLISDADWLNKNNLIKKLHYPNIGLDINQKLSLWEDKLHQTLIKVNRRIQAGENHSFALKKKKAGWYLKYDAEDEVNHKIFSSVGNINISDLLFYINQATDFIKVFRHIKPRYSKQQNDISGIVACILANGFGFGIYQMSNSSDINYSFLHNIEKNFITIENLKAANDIISNKIYSLEIFSLWNTFAQIENADKLLAGADGQKFSARLETIQTRYSPKYFGLGKGVVDYSLVANHVPVNSKIIGANEHESHYIYDIIYNNTSEIDPEAITGDMHSINRVNFAVLDSIGKLFMPNFRNPENQVQTLKSLKPLHLYKSCTIKPSRMIRKDLIISEWDNIQRIFVSLASQETTQSNIIRKLSSHKRYSRTKQALWEYDSILKSIYILEFIDDNMLRKQIRKVLNRVEAYHQLRSAISKVHSGKFRGRTIIENEIWNQCSRLIANCIIFYNAKMLDTLLKSLENQKDTKKIAMLKKISPVAWRHVNLIGKYEFVHEKSEINLEKIVQEMSVLLENTN